jgi:CTP:phosphocholine cytidylyltransferase involved in choline phosphorylation for cell surface LPS epitopes
MAAGTASRFAPLSYEKPKALLRVKGEILIERQIRQLQEAGISEIIVVVGYMAEKFMYLNEKYGVKIVFNEDYNRYNNTSSVIRIINELSDTYLCSSDNFFSENVFIESPKDSYYSALYSDGETGEYCLTTDEKNNIVDVKVGGCDSWYMVGHVFFNKEFSEKFREIMKKEYNRKETRLGYWEDVYVRYINELPPMKIHRYMPHDIEEFDSLDELRRFDKEYINNTGCKMFQNICSILKCEEKDIYEIDVLKKGMTNCSFAFSCRKNSLKYVYRHPGAGTERLVNRDNEQYALHVAREIGLDKTFVYMHPTEGWKISVYIENVETLNSTSIQRHDNMDKIVDIYRRLHHTNLQLKTTFNIFHEIDKYDKLIEQTGATMYEGWELVRNQVMDLKNRLDCLGIDLHPCHNDAVAENFIKAPEGTIYLIDWEYSGMNDPMADFAALFLESSFTPENQNYIISNYYDGIIPDGTFEKIQYYQILWDFLWAQWTIIKEANGDDFGTYGIDRFHRGILNLQKLRN